MGKQIKKITFTHGKEQIAIETSPEIMMPTDGVIEASLVSCFIQYKS